MLTHPTLDLLHDLGLHGMAKGFKGGYRGRRSPDPYQGKQGPARKKAVLATRNGQPECSQISTRWRARKDSNLRPPDS